MTEQGLLIELPEVAEISRSGRTPPVFVDTRRGPDYRRGHIPGAVHLDTFDYANERTDSEGWSVATAHWRETFASVGLAGDQPVVFYDGGLENRAARNGFMLRYLGHPQTYVLHGGMTAWVRSGLPIDRETHVRERGPLPIGRLQEGMVALMDDVRQAIATDSAMLIDVRDIGEFDGRVRLQWNPRMGRIPGAIPLEWRSLLIQEQIERRLVGTPFYPNGMLVGMKDENSLLGRLAEMGAAPTTDVILYCQKSHRASTVFLILERLGYSRLRVYPGSYREWSRQLDLPVIRTSLKASPGVSQARGRARETQKGASTA